MRKGLFQPQVQCFTLAGATWRCRWCDSLMLHQQQWRLAGATCCGRWCDTADTQMRLRADVIEHSNRRSFKKIARMGRADVNARAVFISMDKAGPV